ncbi:MAG: 4-(cytidine 5'-diphospho)-2-C-methyl-D-erythritol kinase [Proteobacteria bacterium]|nr:4-(cytidine 5'-diphospho)-2-C-methyl-D-erythritol kinase [Pseudomonadota bacterium]
MRVQRAGPVAREAAPAKLNLHLHVLGRRDDGYHELDTSFALIDWCDEVELSLRNDGEIHRLEDQVGIDAGQDLAVRAATCMKLACEEAGIPCPGVNIRVRKHIPQGAGLGGGSSDAATVIRLLNQLWGLHMNEALLSRLGLSLGADVPVFIRRRHALGGGVGERLSTLDLATAYFVVVMPPIAVSTATVFADPKLTRASKALKISDCPVWSDFMQGHNDLQAVVTQRFHLVEVALDRLRYEARLLGIAPHWPRMSGSGAAVFCMVRDAAEGVKLEASVKASLSVEGWKVKLVSTSLPTLD